ncbi:hypothetical protein AX15_004149 [Amanita polypyramis BW_CC]|nr:hypothetical protein AX15_004149 [Amanita polypyramis BW_CC]
MTSLSARPSTSQSELRVKRKPPPFLDLSLAERYPPPDPADPFAPLWVLRNRTSSAQLMHRRSIYNLSLDRRRQSAFSLQHVSSNLSDDDMRAVMSDSEHTQIGQTLRHSRARQRSHSAYEFPSVHPVRAQRPSTGFSERSYSGTDAGRLDRQPRALHIASDTTQTQKKLGQLLKSRKLSSLIHPTSPPRVQKASISGPVLTSKPPAMNTFNLTLQTSVTDPQHSTFASPLVQGAPRRRRPSTAPVVQTTSSRSQTVQLPMAESILHKIDNSTPHSQLLGSISHSAFIHISYPTPSDKDSQSVFENAYVSPRPAPRPPQESAARSPLNVKRSSKTSPRLASKSKPKPLPVVPSAAQPEWALPTQEQLMLAASLLVIAESGVRTTFGSLFEKQRTIVIFIRHFWCPLCQDYMSSVRSFVRPDVLYPPATLGAEDGGQTKLVIISNGSHAIISKYRQIFHMPFDMYTDPTLAVYTTLGMGRGSDGVHPMCSPMAGGPSGEPTGANVQKKGNGPCNGGYVKHGTMGGIIMVVVRALKVGMPVWEKGGNVAQLGGEFVFGPGLTCSYAHRMQSSKGHAPIQDVVKAALEVADGPPAAEKKKPLPTVDVNIIPACPVDSPIEGIEENVVESSPCSYETASEEANVSVQETYEGQGAFTMKQEKQERGRKMEREQSHSHLRQERSPRQEFVREGATGLGRNDGYGTETADGASVVATCSDLDRSDGSTMRQSTESEDYTLNELLDEGNDHVGDKSSERPENTQLELEN